jgi:hypothetical protein
MIITKISVAFGTLDYFTMVGDVAYEANNFHFHSPVLDTEFSGLGQ